MLGMKDFYEALKDSFTHITDVKDIEQLRKFRQEGIRVDEEGYYTFTFGDRNEYELSIEPILDADTFYVALYKHRVLLAEKLPVRALKERK